MVTAGMQGCVKYRRICTWLHVFHNPGDILSKERYLLYNSKKAYTKLSPTEDNKTVSKYKERVNAYQNFHYLGAGYHRRTSSYIRSLTEAWLCIEVN